MTYPVTSSDIDPVDRLTILAAALPGAAVGQRRIAAPFNAVWQVIADLEHATPRYEPGVARVRLIEQRGEFLRLLVQDTAAREHVVDARLRTGWCLMQSATIVIAFAARRLGSQTLLAHLEHWRTQSPMPRRSQPHDRSAALAKIDQELRTIETLAIQNRHLACRLTWRAESRVFCGS
jgi:endonuclease/exonuclease/phosphatase family metal-dependent hydrolase